MTVGQRIAHHRGRLKFSQLELAEQLNVSRQSVSKWETDASTPELGKLVEMSQIFGITLDELVMGVETSEEEVPIAQSTSTSWLQKIRKHHIILKVTWWMLFLHFILFAFLLRGDSYSLTLIFLPQLLDLGLANILRMPGLYILWGLIILWTLCAFRSTLWSGHRWLAIGWGTVLVCCGHWLSPSAIIDQWELVDQAYVGDVFINQAYVGYIIVVLSVAVPLLVLFATWQVRKTTK